MSMRSRLIVTAILFPVLTVLFLTVAPIGLSPEPSLALVARVVPDNPSESSPGARRPLDWNREPPEDIVGAARTADSVVVFDARGWQSLAIENERTLDLSVHGAVTAVDGVSAVLRPGETVLLQPRASAAVLRGDHVFSIDGDGAGFTRIADDGSPGIRSRVAGPLTALEVRSDQLWAADAFGFLYLYDEFETARAGERVVIRRPEAGTQSAIYALSVHTDGRLAIVEGLRPSRITVVYPEQGRIEPLVSIDLDADINRPRHLAWADDTVLFETDSGIATLDTDSGDVNAYDIEGRVIGLVWHEALELILVASERPDEARSRLSILYAEDLTVFTELDFSGSMYSMLHSDNHVFLGLDDMVLIYELTR